MPGFTLEFTHFLRATVGPSRDMAVVAAAEATLALPGPKRYRIKNIGSQPCNIRVFQSAGTNSVAATDMVLGSDESIEQWVGVLGNLDARKDGPSVVHAQCFAPAVATTLRITEISRS